MNLEAILAELAAQPLWLGALALFAAALIEYVFPPFPGDAICLFGAFLVGHGGWSLPVVFAAVLAGNVAGFAADYGLGVWMRRRVARRGAAGHLPSPRWRTILGLEERFRTRAAATLLLNRFLPGIRAFLFVGAGFFGYPFARTLLWGTLSALAWNALIFAAGVAVGLNWDELSTWLTRYTTVVWILLGLLAVALLVRWRLRRRAGGGG
ncbi:MAG: DedA family protein [Deltaproteobacteria bacterium]|nr:DedA family protein [Deltaproteobacteria bacterium]